MKYPIVSIEINNSCYSCTFDSQKTSVIGKKVTLLADMIMKQLSAAVL